MVWDSIGANEAAIDPNCSYCLEPIPGVCGCTNPEACNYNADAVNEDGSCTVDAACSGCMDNTACNFSPVATFDDGSCNYMFGCTNPIACNYDTEALCENGTCSISCNLCTDSEACNFNPEATEDDGSCCYSNCLVFQMNDTFGDGWNNAVFSFISNEGDTVSTGTLLFGTFDMVTICLDDGCYSLSVSAGSFPSEMSWALEGTNMGNLYGAGVSEISFSVEQMAECGCMDTDACNFSQFATEDDGSCLYGTDCWGCLDNAALNYDDIAIWDDGSCQYSVSALIFYDTNGDGQHQYGEPPLENLAVHVDELSATLFSDEFGFIYLNNLPPGSYTLNLLADPEWQPTGATTQVVTVPDSGISSWFGLVPTGSDILFSTAGYASLPVLLCDNGLELGMYMNNVGENAINGTFSISFSNLLTANSTNANEPEINEPGFISWNIGGLLAGEGTFYGLDFTGPGVNFLGQAFTFYYELSLVDAEQTVYENTWSEEYTVACSYDPNDKQAEPEGYAEPHFIHPGERIVYTIRFQNTGNWPATDVVIMDMLDATVLDIATFQPLFGSHEFETVLQDNGMLEFSFLNIMLPDSTNNEPDSHGQVKFAINAKDDLLPGTMINNTANIYFDSNPAVVTNTTWHTIVDCESFTPMTGDVELCMAESSTFEAVQDYVESYTWLLNGEVAGNAPVFMFQATQPAVY